MSARVAGLMFWAVPYVGIYSGGKFFTQKRSISLRLFQDLLFLQVFDELVAVARYPFACLFDNWKRIFLALCGDEKFRVRELEFYHILCHINVRVAQNLLNKGIHKCMSLSLDEESHFIIFEIEYFNNHAPMFGHLKTIKVWVAPKTGTLIITPMS